MMVNWKGKANLKGKSESNRVLAANDLSVLRFESTNGVLEYLVTISRSWCVVARKRTFYTIT